MATNLRRYNYRAYEASRGEVIKGKIQAPNEYALEQILRDSNMVLISSREIKNSRISQFFDRITTKDLITFFIHLEQLERAGVPLLESIGDLKDNASNQKLRDITQEIYEDMKGGKLLSETMSKFPKIFDTTMVSLVSMGEKTGNLEVSFKNIYENLKWNADIKKKTVKAVRYPLFSMLVLIVVVGILLKVVVPKVTGFIMDQDIEVPSYTTALMNTSKFLEDHFAIIVLTPIAIYALIKIISISSEKASIKIDEYKLKLPMIGQIMQKIELARFTKFFGVTFSSGIPVLECLDISGSVIKNKYIKKEIQHIRQQVSDGKSVFTALSMSSFFPSLVLRMFKVGEESGNFNDAMKNIQYFYDTEIDDSIEIIIGSLQPMIIFVMGGMMAWVILAVFGPIYGNFDNLGV